MRSAACPRLWNSGPYGERSVPWNLGVWKSLEKELEQGASLLVVAHGVTGRELPPEPSDFLEHSKVWLPKGTEMALAYFGVSPSVEEVLPSLKGKKVLVLPFLIGEGKHMREDMPSPELAARFGKEVKILPPFGTFYLQAEHASRAGGAGRRCGKKFRLAGHGESGGCPGMVSAPI